MAGYIIEGGKKLEGEVRISGSKNASLPIIAASILNGKTTTLYNVPNIQDTRGNSWNIATIRSKSYQEK